MDPAQSLLTEHLGFAPLTLIDEVINAVNHIMYRCTDALETFLANRRKAQIEEIKAKSNDSDVVMDDAEPDFVNPEFQHRVFPQDEIRLGTAELETLLVAHVDRAFDKFELYTLRNILAIPQDLVANGWLRLKHHESLDLPLQDPTDSSIAELDEKIKEITTKINHELTLRKILQAHLARASKLLKTLRHYKDCVYAITGSTSLSRLLPEAKASLKNHLEPLNENVYYLLGQADALIKQTLKLETKLSGRPLDSSSNLKFQLSFRDIYMNTKLSKLLADCQVKEAPAGSANSYLISALSTEYRN